MVFLPEESIIPLNNFLYIHNSSVSSLVIFYCFSASQHYFIASSTFAAEHQPRTPALPAYLIEPIQVNLN